MVKRLMVKRQTVKKEIKSQNEKKNILFIISGLGFVKTISGPSNRPGSRALRLLVVMSKGLG